jgi:hypothetical protein
LPAAAIREADPTITPQVASALADTLDAVSGAVLSTVPVISPASARYVLGAAVDRRSAGRRVTQWG